MEILNKFEPLIPLQDIPGRIYNKTLSADDRLRLSRGQYTSLLVNVQLPGGEVKDNLKFCIRINKSGKPVLEFQEKKPYLIFEDRILNYILTQEDKKELLSGRMVGPVRLGRSEVYLGIDTELTGSWCSTPFSLSIPGSLEAHTFTASDKKLLQHGIKLPTKVFKATTYNRGFFGIKTRTKSWFMASIQMTEGNKGFAFYNARQISEKEAMELSVLYNNDKLNDEAWKSAFPG